MSGIIRSCSPCVNNLIYCMALIKWTLLNSLYNCVSFVYKQALPLTQLFGWRVREKITSLHANLNNRARGRAWFHYEAIIVCHVRSRTLAMTEWIDSCLVYVQLLLCQQHKTFMRIVLLYRLFRLRRALLTHLHTRKIRALRSSRRKRV